MTTVRILRFFSSASRSVPRNLLARAITVGSPFRGAISVSIGGGPAGLTVVEYITGTLAARALASSDEIAGKVAVQSGFGVQTAVLTSRISNAVVPASSVTA